ncbi:hypothetical protein [Sphingomonas sp.]|uniref:hypothetical protein n=1 Tax=Sphingomonas sp. TaxID=28214 RepID=UPI00262C63D5|nr:hypothetical protein [Sphingomonas sp.]MDF2605141.1 hypothetical protein [Sphingomonas sp.]
MNWVTGLFASAHDEVRFRLHDRQTRRAEAADAALAFPTAQLEADLEQARGRLAGELERRFDGPMRANRSSLATIYARVAALDAEYATLTRDHPGELKVAYAEVEELKAKLASAKRAVSDAHDDHNAAKGRISSWHNRSKSRIPIHGKRGKPIPARSIFFFSHSDLDSAKRDADRASSRIGDAKRVRDRVFTELRRCGDLIGELKDSRERRRQLLAAGRTPAKVLADKASLQSEISRLMGAERRMQRLRDQYATAGATALEIIGIQERITEARTRQKERLRSFDDESARASRRVVFREGIVFGESD